jgi:opacity protein-like surface antigen
MRLFSTAVFCVCVASASPSAAQQPSADSEQGPSTAAASDQAGSSDAAQIDELRRRLEVLAAEVEQLRSGETPQIELTDERRRSLGLAPSAAATYRRASEGVSFAGYGEMLLENFKSENESGTGGAPTTRLDFLRAILYAGYRFNDRFLFNSEIEIEHSNEISVEFAHVDYLAHDNLTVRAGMLLLPLGLVNEFHEPTVFIGAKRPETEQRILPTTWRENGAGVLGSAGMVNVRAYVTNGLRGAAFTSAGLRGGRQKGGNALAANLAFSGRVDVTPVPGIFGGVGLYRGGSGQEQVVLSGDRLDLGTTVVELHGQAQLRGFDIRALFAQASVDDAGAASRALQLAAAAPIAERMQGGYLQAGYDVLSQFDTPVALTPYVRYEHVDTQHRVPAGFIRDRSRDGLFKTLGVELKPIPNVVVKTDYQWISNEAGTGRNQVNVNLGYAF